MYARKRSENVMSENVINETKNTTMKSRILTIIGIVLCVILAPLLIFNIILVIEGAVNPDEVPGIAGFKPMLVLTDSMEDYIFAGDLIVIKEVDPKELKTGDVITFFDPVGNGTSTVTHRIIDVVNDETGLWFQTQGDNNNTPDRELVEASAVVGIYVFRIPYIAHVALFMQTVPGLIISIFVPLCAFICYDLIRRKQYEKKKDEDRDALLAELEALRAEKNKKNEDTQV
jgi:signal peptidase